MKFLTREQILAAKDLPHVDVEVKEWGGYVRVRMLRGTDRAKLIAGVSEDKSVPDDWVERMIIACTTDEDGKRLFTKKDIKELSKKNSLVLQKIFDVADGLNSVSGNAKAKLKGE